MYAFINQGHTTRMSFLKNLQSEIQNLGVGSIICCGLSHWFIDSCSVPLSSYSLSVRMPVFNIFRQTSFTLDFHSATWPHSMLIALVRPKSQIKLYLETLVTRTSANKFCRDTIWSVTIYKCWKFGMVEKMFMLMKQEGKALMRRIPFCLDWGNESKGGEIGKWRKWSRMWLSLLSERFISIFTEDCSTK